MSVERGGSTSKALRAYADMNFLFWCGELLQFVQAFDVHIIYRSGRNVPFLNSSQSPGTMNIVIVRSVLVCISHQISGEETGVEEPRWIRVRWWAVKIKMGVK
jgi:hypothetical protein